jgi:SSS family transporter
MIGPNREVAVDLRVIVLVLVLLGGTLLAQGNPSSEPFKSEFLAWQALPDLPGQLGVAGPFVGVHRGALIVAGGANFPSPFWETEKAWHGRVSVLLKRPNGDREWLEGYGLDRPVAYGASTSTEHGIVCLGGSDGEQTFDDAFLLTWDPSTEVLRQIPLPRLPQPCAYGAATRIGDVVYLAGGQSGQDLETALRNLWRLDLSKLDGPTGLLQWETVVPWPGPSRAFNIAVAQHNGFNECIYVLSGRRVNQGKEIESTPGFPATPNIFALQDVYEFNPANYDPQAFDAESGQYRGVGRFANPWRRRSQAPYAVMGGTGATIGQSHIFVLSGADGKLMDRSADLKETHPGFPHRILAYHTITDTWIDAGSSPANMVTTPAVRWEEEVILASGEIKPRIRTQQVWAIKPVSKTPSFGLINSGVLILYLLAMLCIGLYFSKRNRDTNDYFRGGQKIAWWVAGCSIFATMLSSITYMAIPAKAYAQDQTYLLGNLMILAVAPIAVYLALPFFRQIDATSAYEYLEKRFNRSVRLFASASFITFHVLRMGIVLSLAGLALATVTPLSATQCVLIMGVLSVIYCTIGGIEAVVWTDTIQTFLLLGGAVLCLGLMVTGTDGGFGSLLSMAGSEGKLNLLNLHWDPTSTSIALWVVILGALGQNISSYTSDQAVVQRYMTTPDAKRAAASIWTAAILAVPASILFFGLGTSLYGFYKAHPEKLDPTYMTDQIFPLFISREVPVGVAGLIVAGIFAAAQSTISTSMNSTATAVVTDFLRPFRALANESDYLRWARRSTLFLGILGTLLGLLFIDPQNRSLFDSFIQVIGLFMGVLGGLFLLGILTRRTTGRGALIGALSGVAVMGLIPTFTQINGYLYAAIGITVCFLSAYLISLASPASPKSIQGLTVHTLTAGPEN